jgi:hypothetical protein
MDEAQLTYAEGKVASTKSQFRCSWQVSKLRRITTSGAYVPEIDGLRLVAILSMVIYHISIQTMSESGQAGGQACISLIDRGHDRAWSVFVCDYRETLHGQNVVRKAAARNARRPRSNSGPGASFRWTAGCLFPSCSWTSWLVLFPTAIQRMQRPNVYIF